MFYYLLFKATTIINKLIKGGDSVAKKVNLSYIMHPSLRFKFYFYIKKKLNLYSFFNLYRRAAKIVQKGFEDYACNKQNFLGDDTRINKLLTLAPAEYKFNFFIFFVC